MNNKKHIQINKTALHFKKWTRAGFAVFCSCSRVVHIAHLATNIASWIGKIIELVDQLLQHSINQQKTEKTENEEEESLSLLVGNIMSNPLLINPTVQTACSYEAFMPSYIKYKNKDRKKSFIHFFLRSSFISK